MAVTDTTLPSEAEQARRDFACWISGFVAGEGCFLLWHDSAQTPHATFRLDLRADDYDILRQVREYFGCGNGLYLRRAGREGTKPQARFDVNKVADLAHVVVPHFDAYPLRAKKQRDFAIWRRGVLLVHHVSQRPYTFQPGAPRWTAGERAAFAELAAALKSQRAYTEPPPFPTGGRPKATAEQVRSIRAGRAAGCTLKALAATHGLSKWVVRSIVRRRTWRHI